MPGAWPRPLHGPAPAPPRSRPSRGPPRPARSSPGKENLLLFVFHELASDLAFLSLAEEVALFLGTVVVLAAERAAAVSRQRHVAHPTLRARVEMAVEDGPQVVFFESLQHRVGVRGP